MNLLPAEHAHEAIGNADLDWMLLFHPVSIRWLTGTDAKSYQEFQCLLISAKPGPITVLTRNGERNEFLDDALVDQLQTWGGGEPEDPIAALSRLAESLGVTGTRIGMEVPGYYLHPHHYVRIKQLFGESLVTEATSLIHDLTLVKSATELRYIREANRIAGVAMQRFTDSLAEGRSELEIAGEVYHALLTSGSGLAASPINLVSGERSCFSHGAPTDRRLRAVTSATSSTGRPSNATPPRSADSSAWDNRRRECENCTILFAVPRTPASPKFEPVSPPSFRTRRRSE